jgi:hypothetical protein
MKSLVDPGNKRILLFSLGKTSFLPAKPERAVPVVEGLEIGSKALFVISTDMKNAVTYQRSPQPA